MDRAVIADEARRRLGGLLALGGMRVYGMLARLLHPGEAIDAMALGRLRGGGAVGSQRLVVATPLRLLLVEKGFVTGRERLREVAWDAITGVEVTPPGRLELALSGERLDLHLLHPPRELGAIADLVRARLDPARATTPTSGELLDLARRKLGRLTASAAEPAVIVLAGLLEPDETVLELAFATAGADSGLLAASTRRLAFVPTRGLGAGAPVLYPYASIAACEVAEDGLRVRTAGGEELVVASAAPVERGLTVAQITAARMAGAG